MSIKSVINAMTSWLDAALNSSDDTEAGDGLQTIAAGFAASLHVPAPDLPLAIPATAKALSTLRTLATEGPPVTVSEWVDAGRAFLELDLLGLSHGCLKQANALVRGPVKVLSRELEDLQDFYTALYEKEWATADPGQRNRSLASIRLLRRTRLRRGRGKSVLGDSTAVDCAYRFDIGSMARLLATEHFDLPAIELLLAWAGNRYLFSSQWQAVIFLALATGLLRLGDSGTAASCLQFCAAFAGLPVSLEEVPPAEGELAWMHQEFYDLLRAAPGLSDLTRDSRDILQLNCVSSALADWCLEHKTPSTFCKSLLDLPSYRNLYQPAALRRQIRWMAQKAGCIPEFAFSTAGVSLLTTRIFPAGRPLPLPLGRRQIHSPQWCLDSDRLRTVTASSGYDHQVNESGVCLDLAIGFIASTPPRSLSFEPRRPFLLASKSSYKVLALSAVTDLVDHGHSVLWIRSGTDRDLRLPPSLMQSVVHLISDFREPSEQVTQWFESALSDGMITNGLSDQLAKRSPEALHDRVRTIMPEVLRTFRNHVRDPWTLSPIPVVKRIRSLLLPTDASVPISLSDIRRHWLATESITSTLRHTAKSFCVEVAAKPEDAAQWAVLDLPDDPTQSAILRAVSLGGLFACDFDLNATSRDGSTSASTDVPEEDSRLGQWSGVRCQPGKGTTCVVMSGPIADELTPIVTWFKQHSSADVIALAVFCPSLERSVLRRDTIGEFGTVIAPKPEHRHELAFSASLGCTTGAVPDVAGRSYAWVLDHHGGRAQPFIPCPQ